MKTKETNLVTEWMVKSEVRENVKGAVSMVETNQFQNLPKLNPSPAVNEPQVRLNVCA